MIRCVIKDKIPGRISNADGHLIAAVNDRVDISNIARELLRKKILGNPEINTKVRIKSPRALILCIPPYRLHIIQI